MSKEDLKKLRRELDEEKRRFLASLPEDKRRELEREEEILVPQFLRDWKKRIKKARRALHSGK